MKDMKNMELIEKTTKMLIVNDLYEAERIYEEESEEAARKYIREACDRIEANRKVWLEDICEEGAPIGKWEEELNTAQIKAQEKLVIEFNWYVWTDSEYINEVEDLNIDEKGKRIYTAEDNLI